jgi:asparagine synthase (glutamine-hydrolysing)
MVLLWNPADPSGLQVARSAWDTLAHSPDAWVKVYECNGALVAQCGARRHSIETHHLGRRAGVVLGSLFHRSDDCNSANVASVIDDDESERILASAGQRLVDSYWGSYVAILCDELRRRIYVFRDPTNNMPCYHTRHGKLDVIFSHVEDGAELLGIPFSVDRHQLVRWLINGRQAERETCLSEVEDLPGGERQTFCDGRVQRHYLWNPVAIAAKPRFDEPGAAAKQVRRTVQQSINAWAANYQHIAVKLSGGLDSSIVAGCLAQAPSKPQVTYLNFSIDETCDKELLHLPGVDKLTAARIRSISGSGDERQFARLVARQWGVPMVEMQRDVDMDLRRIQRVPLSTCPAMFHAVMELDDAEAELASRLGVQAFFSGQAGDSVLLATMQPLAAIDYASMHGLHGLWGHVIDTALLSRESAWSVLAKAIRHGMLGQPYRTPAHVLEQPTLLGELISNLSSRDFESHWERMSSSLPPGKRNHVSGLAGSVFYDFVFQSQALAAHVDPLNAQPVWELMLSIPTHIVLAGGVSRGLARMAFAELLPREIRTRQVKGAGSAFYQQVVRKNRSLLKEHLLDGTLVREGYLDRRKVEAYLTADEPFVTVNAGQVLSYLAAEHWVSRWSRAKRAVSNSQPSMACIG